MDVVFVYLLLLIFLLNLEVLILFLVIIIELKVMKGIVEFRNYDFFLRLLIIFYDLFYEKLELKKG